MPGFAADKPWQKERSRFHARILAEGRWDEYDQRRSELKAQRLRAEEIFNVCNIEFPPLTPAETEAFKAKQKKKNILKAISKADPAVEIEGADGQDPTTSTLETEVAPAAPDSPQTSKTSKRKKKFDYKAVLAALPEDVAWAYAHVKARGKLIAPTPGAAIMLDFAKRDFKMFSSQYLCKLVGQQKDIVDPEERRQDEDIKDATVGLLREMGLEAKELLLARAEGREGEPSLPA